MHFAAGDLHKWRSVDGGDHRIACEPQVPRGVRGSLRCGVTPPCRKTVTYSNKHGATEEENEVSHVLTALFLVNVTSNIKSLQLGTRCTVSARFWPVT